MHVKLIVVVALVALASVAVANVKFWPTGFRDGVSTGDPDVVIAVYENDRKVAALVYDEKEATCRQTGSMGDAFRATRAYADRVRKERDELREENSALWAFACLNGVDCQKDGRASLKHWIRTGRR